MKSGRSIQDVSREILRQQEAKADYLVATDRLYMDTYGDSPVTVSYTHLASIFSTANAQGNGRYAFLTSLTTVLTSK